MESCAEPALVELGVSLTSSSYTAAGTDDSNRVRVSSEDAYSSWVKIEMEKTSLDGSGNEEERLGRQREDVSVGETCITALTQAFLLHINRLATYPSFDKLWLRLLYVLGYFIGSNSSGASTSGGKSGSPGSDSGVDKETLAFLEATVTIGLAKGVDRRVLDLMRAVKLCKEKLLVLLKTLINNGVFTKREGLWLVTQDIVNQFHCCQTVITDVTGKK